MKASPLLRVSLVVHAVALMLVLWHPRWWPMAVTLLVANHLVLTALGLWPRSSGLGPNRTRLGTAAHAAGRIAVTIDDGPDPAVTPAVLDLLDRHGCRATFFCIGQRVAAHANLSREIIRRGHQIENHTQHHPNSFSLLGPAGMNREITAAQQALRDVAGRAPRYFRAPAGLRNPFLEPVLARHGLELVSWTRRGFDTVTRDPTLVLARLTRGLRAGDILLLHDGHAAHTASGVPVILEVLPALLEAIAAAGLTTVTLEAGLA